MTRQATRLALEIAALVFMLAIFVVGFAVYRLSGGPVDLEVLRPNAEEIFAEAFDGETVELGEIRSEWRPESRAIVVTARNVAIRDETGEVVSVASRIATALPAASLAQGRFAPLWVEAEGGAFAVVRRRDGSFAFGLGTPRRAVREEEETTEGAPSLDWREFELPDGAANLRRLALSDVVLFVQLRDIGLNWRIRHASLDADLSGQTLSADLAGELLQENGYATISALVSADLGVKRIAAEGVVSGFNPSQSAPQRLAGWARSIDAPLDLNWRLATARQGRLTGGRLTARLGAGEIAIAGQQRPISGADLRMRYEAGRQAMVLEALQLESDVLSLRGEGAVTNLFSDGGASPEIELSLGEFGLDMPGLFEEPLSLTAIEFEGGLLQDDVSGLTIDRLSADLGGFSLGLQGSVAFVQNAGEWAFSRLALEGGTEGYASPQDLLRYWPLDFADGGRVWIAEHVDAGRIHDAEFELTMTDEDVARGRLNEDDMRLAFAMDQGEVRYVSTMSPVTQASGSAVLRGNSFSLEMDEGRIGEMVLTEGRVEIPRLKPKGAPAVIAGAGRATASDVLKLLDEEPLGFPSAFGIDPDSVQGEGEIRFELTRPMRSEVPIERIGFDVEADFENVSAPTGIGALQITDGKVHLEGTPFGLIARGPGRIGPVEALISWEERFGEPEEIPSTIFNVEAVLDQEDFDALGVPLRQFLNGPVLFSARTEGDGLAIEQGAASVDLTSAAIGSAGDFWNKPQNSPAGGRFEFTRNDDGFQISSARLTGPGLEAAGAARFSGQGQLDNIRLETVRLDQFADFSLNLSRNDAVFELDVEGDYLDARWLVDQILSDAGAGKLGIPVSADIVLDRAVISDALTAEQVTVAFDHSGERIETASVDARAAGEPVAIRLAPGAGEARTLSASAQDAGLLFEALFGIDQVRGGRFTLDGRSEAADAPWNFEARVEEFDLVRAPILARLFALASLQGLADVLGGSGLSFNEMIAEASLDQGRIRIEQARASGQALGITTSGEIDMPRSELALNGVLVPSYGVNASVGALPVIGDLLTSREGEGLFALTYSVSGPFDQTQVVVNPLSALAPGIFRRIFEGGVSLEEAQAEAARQSAETPDEEPAVEQQPESGDEPGEEPPG